MNPELPGRPHPRDGLPSSGRATSNRLNKILEDAGLGRPLRHPEAGSPPGAGYGEIVRSWLDAHPGKQSHAEALAAAHDGGTKVEQLANRLHFDLQVDKLLGHLNETQVLAGSAAKSAPPDAFEILE